MMIAGLLLLPACAGGEPPTTQLALAQSAVDEATRDGAAERAPQDLISAREKLARADEAAKAERYTDARRMAEEAEADARLAATKSRSAAAAATLGSLTQGNTTLQQEIRRQQTPAR